MIYKVFFLCLISSISLYGVTSLSSSLVDSQSSPSNENLFSLGLETKMQWPEHFRNDKPNVDQMKWSTTISPGYNLSPDNLVLLDIKIKKEIGKTTPPQKSMRKESNTKKKSFQVEKINIRNLYFLPTTKVNYTFEIGLGLPFRNIGPSLSPSLQMFFNIPYKDIKPFIRTGYRRNFNPQRGKQIKNQAGLVSFISENLSIEVSQSVLHLWNEPTHRRLDQFVQGSMTYALSRKIDIELGVLALNNLLKTKSSQTNQATEYFAQFSAII